MSSFGFIQAGYATRGLVADVQRWVNMYVEKTESGQGANHDTGLAAYCTPGKNLLVTCDDAPLACVVPSNSAFYAASVNLFYVVSGSTLYAITATFDIPTQLWTGVATSIGTVDKQVIAGTGGQLFPAQVIVIQPNQLFVVANGQAWVAAFGTAIATDQLNPQPGGGGAGYAVGDTFTYDNGLIPATGTVDTVDAMGAVLTYHRTANGTGYSVSTGGVYETTTPAGAQPGNGEGLSIQILTVAAPAWLLKLQVIPQDSFGNFIRSATWMDGYVIVSMAPNAADPLRRQFFISGNNDPNAWSALDFATKEANSDPVIAVFAADEILILFGSQTMEIWQDSDNVLFPFQRIPGGGVIEYGLAQTFAVTKYMGTVAWLSSDARGQYTAMMLNGGSAMPISNPGIENAWSLFDTAGASVYSYRESGHEFLVWHFPIPDKTWVYDHKMGPLLGWHERVSRDDQNVYHADIGRYHGFFPEIGHCVGDYSSGNLYLQSLQFLTENCNPIPRIRVGPHLVTEKKRNIIDRLRLHCLTGIVPETGPGSDPVCSIRISHNGGKTFGPYRSEPMGKIGEYEHDINWFHNGYGRDNVIEWSCLEPIDIVLVDMYVDMRLGFN